MMLMMLSQMGSEANETSVMDNLMLMMSLLGGGGGMVGPGGINPMMMLMMANMGRDGKTDPKLKEYLDKSYDKGKRKLSIGVNYGSVPMEYQFMESFFGFPSPATGSFMNPSMRNLFSPSSSNYGTTGFSGTSQSQNMNYKGGMSQQNYLGSMGISSFPQMGTK